jgi:5-oxopent-3-ene-1,2,5-tricarboxylate decarboxylase / 2-hydroxyhepta-2,4-diene-1,7-dioate isomerase
VIVVPAPLAAEVAKDAAEQERQETFAAEQVAKGASVDGLFPLGPAWQAAYEAWLRERA